MPLFGTRVLRIEDPHLLVGDTSFVADVDLPGVLHVGYVTSTLAHDKMHVASGVILTAGSLHMAAFCKAFTHPECAKLEPLTLAASEVASHDAGIKALEQAIRSLLAATEDCTTDAGAPSPTAPTGIGPRVGALFSRFINGAPQP